MEGQGLTGPEVAVESAISALLEAKLPRQTEGLMSIGSVRPCGGEFLPCSWNDANTSADFRCGHAGPGRSKPDVYRFATCLAASLLPMPICLSANRNAPGHIVPKYLRAWLSLRVLLTPIQLKCYVLLAAV